ncbi:DUF881 domain-containing protein [Schaalia hyovaginalis]|uniref:DUF881 domain-containing protein n=1 Tax=Schaalia hyovaginalis TaxID=29316 RepID=UPI0026F186F6|nr:DUF881 domain-containing protein [Schaalia hyovaginalis]MCI6410316.1 DUF881 domain-containing protein [Schaalia hyovaginalis]MCI6557227.1 DUF881 domain-containing protein [Schaalia hyovaginalis]MCI7512423.1 DUF881 domain-containing protein [Schaalia hyovaginalis]MDY3665095.1 DUF881 domain-containing protein [Schaalia hyovaginalis]
MNADPRMPKGPAGAGEGEDPAASMSLLNQLLANPLDLGYTHYEESSSGALKVWHRVLVVLFSIALGLASVTAVSALRAASEHDVTDDLRDQAKSRQFAVETLQSDLKALSARANRTSTSNASADLAPSLALANSLEAARGPGLVVTLKDSEAAPKNGTTAGQVRDIDLNVVVNALWSAGAEAIAINDIRIGPGTFIRQAGSVILINITPIQSPYVVTAIGDANPMSVALVRGSTGDFLSSASSVNGIALTSAADSSLSVPALDLRVTRTAHPLDTTEGE